MPADRVNLAPIGRLIRWKQGPEIGGPAYGRFLWGAGLAGGDFSGSGYIAGTVTVDGLPAARPLRLYDCTTGDFVRETASDLMGRYRFSGIALGREYLVVAMDSTRIYNAVVADRVEAVSDGG